jgi:hypothetical protein
LDCSQVLYLDCDTFFFADVDILFDKYRAQELYAREEHVSRRNHFGYDPLHVDEDALVAMASQEGLRYVVPINSGVCLFNHGLWNSVGRLDVNFLDLAWRLLVGRLLATSGAALACWGMGNDVMASINELDRTDALPFPSENDWIIEEIAFWLTLGYLPDLSQGLFPQVEVMQNGELDDRAQTGGFPLLAHYFSAGEKNFFDIVDRIEG